MGSIPVQAWIFFWLAFSSTAKVEYITAMVFICLKYIYILFIIYMFYLIDRNYPDKVIAAQLTNISYQW